MSAPGGSPLDAERVVSLLRTAGWRVTGGGVTGSTNDDAKALARAGDPGGVAVLATSQTAGRGRFGRVWDSPGGGVYVSVLLRPAIVPGQIATVPLAAGVAVARALERLDPALGDVLALKWPNDVLADGRKLAGILVESATSGEGLEWVVVGIGINVDPVADTRAAGAVSLSECVAPGSRALEGDRIAAALLDMLAECVGVLEAPEEGFSAILPDYLGLSGDVGRDVVVRDPDGSVVTQGTVTGFDAEGHLLLVGDGGPRCVAAGEVTLRS